LLTNLLSSFTPNAVEPFGEVGKSDFVQVVPAMSKCAQGVLFTNLCKNWAAVIDPG
jgi:hypothetical protein